MSIPILACTGTFILGLLLAVPAQSADKIYWIDGGATDFVQRADLDGTDRETLFEGDISSLFVEPMERKLYWTSEFEVWRSELDGTSPELLFVLDHTPTEINVATDLQKIYWNRGSGLSEDTGLYRANLDGSDLEQLNGESLIYQLLVRSEEGKLYWSQSNGGPLFLSDLDGTGMEILFSGEKIEFFDIHNREVYWGNTIRGDVYRGSLDGGLVEIIAEGRENKRLRALTLDGRGGKVYWWEELELSGNLSQVLRANLGGSDLEVVASDLNNPNTILTGPGPAPPCTLDLTAGFVDIFDGALTLTSILAVDEPSTWNIWISLNDQMLQIRNTSIPVIDPPITIVTQFSPDFPQAGVIGFLSTITMADGIECQDWEVVDTGTPERVLSQSEILELLQGFMPRDP